MNLQNYSNYYYHRKTKGFSLIELVITTSVLAVLGSVAAPSFQNFIQQNKINTASFELRSTMSLARQTAISQP